MVVSMVVGVGFLSAWTVPFTGPVNRVVNNTDAPIDFSNTYQIKYNQLQVTNIVSAAYLKTGLFKLGSSVASGSILATDSNGNGSWQLITASGLVATSSCLSGQLANAVDSNGKLVCTTLPTSTSAVLGGVKSKDCSGLKQEILSVDASGTPVCGNNNSAICVFNGRMYSIGARCINKQTWVSPAYCQDHGTMGEEKYYWLECTATGWTQITDKTCIPSAVNGMRCGYLPS